MSLRRTSIMKSTRRKTAVELCEFIELTNIHRRHTKREGRLPSLRSLAAAVFLRGCSHETTEQIELHQGSPKIEQGLLDLDLPAKIIQTLHRQNVVLSREA